MQLKRDWGRTPKTANFEGKFRCSSCKEWKYPESFNKNKQQRTGLNYACRDCMREKVRKYNLPSKYGITSSKFAEMLLSQGGKCACCGSQFNMEGKKADRPCVDHNHKTNQIRDLLCGKCNLAAGNVQDSSQRAEQIAAYLRKWNC